MKKRYAVLIMFFFFFCFCGSTEAQRVKPYEWAGHFYPQDRKILESDIQNLLDNVSVPFIKGDILGVISPHAGYVFSGRVAAFSYKIIEEKDFDAVILMGPSHRYHFQGISVWPQGAFITPLGKLEVDADVAEELSKLDFIKTETKYFFGEHSLEVQFPFLKKVLKNVKVVPLLFGEVSFKNLEQLSVALSALYEKKKILVVVSTDLSHYYPYKEASRIDNKTIEYVREKDARALWVSHQLGEQRACGITPLISFLLYVKNQMGDVTVLHYANSGDVSKDKKRVVGYVSAVAHKKSFFKSSSHAGDAQRRKEKEQVREEERMSGYNVSQEDKRALLKIARMTLKKYLFDGTLPKIDVDSEELQKKRGVFVTLKKGGELRGCIGRIVADKELYKVVQEYAIHAACDDPRFPHLKKEELDEVEIEISVLSPFQEVKTLDEIEVGTHGLLIHKGFHSGLLLPQVPAEYEWDKKTYLEHLCYKAGLPPDAYKEPDAILSKFTAIVFSENEFGE